MGADITECEQAKSGNCCYCKNMEYYKLQQQLQLEKDNVAELNELLISYKEENEELKENIEIYRNQSPKALEALQISYSNYKRDYENVSKLWKEAEQKLEEINLLAQSLYYHSITDPVKRAEAIDEIIILAGGR